MPKFCELHNWPVEFVATNSNTMDDYAEAVIRALKEGRVDYVVPMPEALLFEGLVDRVDAGGRDTGGPRLDPGGCQGL